MNEYSLDDFKEDVVNDLKDYASPSSMKVLGLEDEFREDVMFPSLKRLEGKILSKEVEEKLEQLKDDIKRCEKKGGHYLSLGVYSHVIDGKEYISGLCSFCQVVVAKEETEEHYRKIDDYRKSQEMIMRTPTI